MAVLAEIIPGISPNVYGNSDFAAVRDIVYGEAGIVLPPSKAMLVYSRLAPLVRSSGAGTFADYVRRIGSDGEERRRAVSALTTNHTFFFRETHHFDHFARSVRPGAVAALERGKPVRFWSAGCSSGEEVWSLAFTMLGEDRPVGRMLVKRDLRILATDIAPHALETATSAVYPAASLDAVPPALRRLWVAQRGNDAEIASEPREIVRFRELNLLGEWPLRVKFDAIFCRNVMIYFDQPTKERLVARFAERLVEGGFLYIGHSERVTGAAAATLQPVGPTIYRKVPA